jgi:two-component system sensor histidine kinase RegB
MSHQIEACRRTLSDLVAYGQGALVYDRRSEPVDKFLYEVVNKWQMLRRGVKLACRRKGSQPPPNISTERNLGHAVLNLLNNAADVSPDAVEMDCSWDSDELKILIQDRGPGIPFELRHMLGKPLFTTKRDKGIGIGLLLAKTAIHGAGGSLRLFNRSSGGACAEILLPLESPREAPVAPARQQQKSLAEGRG